MIRVDTRLAQVDFKLILVDDRRIILDLTEINGGYCRLTALSSSPVKSVARSAHATLSQLPTVAVPADPIITQMTSRCEALHDVWVAPMQLELRRVAAAIASCQFKSRV